MREPALKDLPQYILDWIKTPKIISGEFLLIYGLTSINDYERLIVNEKLKINCVPILINNKFKGTAKLIKL